MFMNPEAEKYYIKHIVIVGFISPPFMLQAHLLQSSSLIIMMSYVGDTELSIKLFSRKKKDHHL